MKTSELDYPLPPGLIAQEPATLRTAARMLVVHRDSGILEHAQVHALPKYLTLCDLLVINDTKVFPARIFGTRTDTGGKAELLFIEEVESGNPSVWSAMIRCRGHVAPGTRILLNPDRVLIEVLARDSATGRVNLRVHSDSSTLDLLAKSGLPPLPPYIKRPKTPGGTDPRQKALDAERYQTVYARQTGAVAAPTAGLHFTPELLDSLQQLGVERLAITLHVGPGTFKPITAENLEDHVMESERYEISASAAARIRQAQAAGKRIVAVGSTSVRTLETAYAEHGAVVAASGRSALFIRPPYSFGVVQAMLTNFHLPRSTLLAMVFAFAGRDLVLRAYSEAVKARYRFYSYGDCMLIL
ncbi:MAG: tRNA preQ1(34) S-adenosylmethionine ribosyltransferase-isomerase QueA [Lentisphaerae bacterium]|nr:tRNA preQ1(34) S-adenosylmethionine ribosyltransferase-isomerase QueA [Lentisphaerota bacterium]